MPLVAMVAAGADAGAARALLATVPGVAAGSLDPADPIPEGSVVPDVIWVHASDEPPGLPRERLVPWLERGGRLLLTQHAVTIAGALGLSPDGPNDLVAGTWRHEADELWFPEFRDHRAFPHVRGIAAFGDHPLFAGLGRGTYLWAPAEGETFTRVTYARGSRPAAAAVVGCERSYVHLNADRIVAWEYGVGDGGVLCIGAFIHPAAADPRFAAQLHRLLTNALAGSGIPSASRAGPVAHWPPPGQRAASGEDLRIAVTGELGGVLPQLDSDLVCETDAARDAPYSLAGRRVLVVGSEQGGVREIWLHPHRALAGLVVTVSDHEPRCGGFRVAPWGVRRRLEVGSQAVVETVTTALRDGVALLDYQPEDSVPGVASLQLEWIAELRMAWPYAADAGGDMSFRVAPDDRSLVVTRAGGAGATFLASHPVAWDVRPVPRQAAVRVRLRTTLERPLRLAVLGGGSPRAWTAALRALARRGAIGVVRQRVGHERAVRAGAVRLRTPDAGLDAALEWAKLRLDGFRIDTPGVGRSLAAGYAASRPGWGDGRPGYGWYFGRDACWSAWAQLALGDHEGPGEVLRFLGATQDVTGKVIHELTTSGVAHYDAADSTPLYLLLAGRYAAWTGDLALLETEWPRLERAYRFCLATDRDGDGLIENSGVGHGWIEMGPLSGAHVTLYLASVWAAALAALAPAARALGRTALADELTQRAARARSTIARRFRFPDGFALGLHSDGTPQRRNTALTAVPLLLGVIEPESTAAWYDAIAGPAFSAPWGVRLLEESDPLYQPAGYHAGAVWPLYTGWVALAEYRGHRAAPGFGHLAANARLPFARQIGAFDEVLRGDREESAGVCPDQCWSAAMLALPLVEGLLGANPDALGGRLLLTPHLPAAWPEGEWRGLRVGSTRLDLRIAVARERMRARLMRVGGPSLTITLSLPIPETWRGAAVEIDGVGLRPRITASSGCRHAAVTFTAVETHDVEWRADPAPGAS